MDKIEWYHTTIHQIKNPVRNLGIVSAGGVYFTPALRGCCFMYTVKSEEIGIKSDIFIGFQLHHREISLIPTAAIDISKLILGHEY